MLVSNIRLYPLESEKLLLKKACKKAGLNPQNAQLVIKKKSLDCRNKKDIHYVYTVDVTEKGSGEESYNPKTQKLVLPDNFLRPIVVGFGPAGMFAALSLARAGLNPLVLERGRQVELRQKDVDNYRSGGKLNPESNVQFGEGGAGTFSDGKLATGTHDSRLKSVLNEFHRFGADKSILYDAKPHIGTDKLVTIVKNLRNEIISLGGEVKFSSKLTDIKTENGSIVGVTINDSEYIPCNTVILATGHSARDTFEMLYHKNIYMEQKPFSMGVRIEHRQCDIDKAQYGVHREKLKLPAADYSLNVKLADGESAYTFCMCPGGEVIAAASEDGGVCTNGMSYSGRAGENANSALLVTLHPEDFPGEGVLAGMYWQREIEQNCYNMGGGNSLAPCQRVGDFVSHVPSTGAGNIKPSYKPGVVWCDLHDVLPEKITKVLERAIPELNNKLHGFADCDAILTAPECRSSSPVRIVRDGKLMSNNIKGLYPCGEGAGYAGGISSAAVDGIRVAEKIIENLKG